MERNQLRESSPDADPPPQPRTPASAPAGRGLLRDAACGLLAAAGAIAPFALALLAGRTLAWRDTAFLNAPLRPLVASALRELRLPLWNPFEGGGQPLFEQSIHAVLHPASLLGALVAPHSVDFLIVASLAMASAGAFAAARSLGASREASVAAAFAYALGGYVVSATSFLNILAGAASAPWVVAGLRLASDGGGARVALGALGVCVGALSGDVQAMAWAVPLGCAVAWEAGGGRGLVRAASTVVLGLAAAGIQLLPAWSYLQTTSRALPELEPAAQWALAPARMVELVLPGFFVGVPHTYRAPLFEALGGPAHAPFPFFPSVFVGIPVLLAATWGARGSRLRCLLVAGAVLSLWLALGPALGASRLGSWLPVWRGFRYPEKFIGLLALCLALGSALGVDALASAGARVRRAVAVTLLLLVLTAACALVASTSWGAPPSHAGADLRGLLGARLLAGAVEAALAVTVLLVVLQPRVRTTTRVLALAGLFFAEGAAATRFGSHPGVRPRTQMVSVPPAADGSPVRVFTPLVVDDIAGVPGDDAIDRATALYLRVGWPPANALAGVDNVESNTGLKPARAAVIQLATGLRSSLARRFASTHVVAPGPQDQSDRELLAEATRGGLPLGDRGSDGVSVWEVPHRPWAFFASRVQLASGLRGAVRALRASVAAGDAGVVLEAAEAPPLGSGTVLHATRTPEQVRIEAESEADGLLVVNDAYSDGWDARIDGAPAEILAADVLVRAVVWPKGRHVLEMRYEPAALSLGKAVSGAGCAGILMALLLGWARRRSPRAA